MIYGCIRLTLLVISADIDECSSPLCSESATCMNTDGSFFCRCQNGFVGDGLVSGSGCSGEWLHEAIIIVYHVVLSQVKVHSLRPVLVPL